MQDIDFHAYVQTVATHMEGWAYRARENVHTGTTELRMAPRVHHTATGAEIYFSRDDHKKRFSAVAETGREIDGRREYLRRDDLSASAGFAQGRDPQQVARAVLAKVADTAIRAHAELNKRAQEAAEARASLLGTIEALNASGLLSRAIAKPRGPGAGETYFDAKGASGRIDSDGDVRFERLSVDAATAIRILAILAERGE